EPHMAKINAINEWPVDMDEFYLHLTDCSILINRIYRHSISQQFRNIIREIGRHYTYITKGRAEVPYEIFIPVFEDKDRETNVGFLDTAQRTSNPNDYFGYWGVYYSSQEEEALVYDLERLRLIPGELFTYD
ncbi:MAG: hypothetical protein AAGA86_00785, partial [Bacteroidota bacterium]